MRGQPQGYHRSVDRGTGRRGIELRNNRIRSADAVPRGGRQHPARREGEPRQDSAQSKTPGMSGNSTRENRETLSTPVIGNSTGRLGKGMSSKSSSHVDGESDGREVPTKCPNNGGQPLAEGMEGRRPTKENIEQPTSLRTQSRASESRGLLGVREVARKDKHARFTALLHHVTVARLQDSFYALKREAAPGVDGTTWHEYKRTWTRNWWRSTSACTRERIERSRHGEPTLRKQMDDSVPWASRPWRTKSSSTQS